LFVQDVLTKSAFASFVSVTRGRVSQWLTERKLSGDALVGSGHRARIRVDVALDQLTRYRSAAKRQRTGAAGRRRPPARIFGWAPPCLERLGQIALSNAKARQEQAARSGRYILAEDARQEMGRIAGRMATLFEASLSEFAHAVTATAPSTPRDALLVLRASWREIRARQAQTLAAEATDMPATIEDGQWLANPQRLALEAIAAALTPPPRQA
jgi:hypothetical protein